MCLTKPFSILIGLCSCACLSPGLADQGSDTQDSTWILVQHFVISTPRKFLKGTCGASYVTGMPCRLLPRYHSGLHHTSSVDPASPHLSVAKLPWNPTFIVGPAGLAIPEDELEAILAAYGAARALQAADIRWHSTTTPRARRSYRAVHHGLDPGPYHAHLLDLWDDCLASIVAQLDAPTSSVSGTANVVGTSVVPAGHAAGAAFPAAIAVFLPRCHSDLRQTCSVDPASPHLPVAKLPQAVADDGLPFPGHKIDLYQEGVYYFKFQG